MLISIISVVVVLVVGIGLRLALKAGADRLAGSGLSDYTTGKCLDAIPASDTLFPTSTDVPGIVDCSDAKAQSSIIGRFPDEGFADADTLCPATTDAVNEITSGGERLLLCLEAVGAQADLVHGVGDYAVGTCIDTDPGVVFIGAQIGIVDCASFSAKAKIVANIDGGTLDNAESECPDNAESAIEMQKFSTGSALLCLVGV